MLPPTHLPTLSRHQLVSNPRDTELVVCWRIHSIPIGVCPDQTALSTAQHSGLSNAFESIMGGQTRENSAYSPQASIALVGLPGAGKRSLSFIAASHLRRKVIWECVYFEQATGLSKPSYMRQYGREAFYSRVVELLQSMLKRYTEDCVLVCGITSLVPGASNIISDFARTHPVVHIRRDHEQVLKGNSLAEAERLHDACSNFEFFNLDDPDTSASFAEPALTPFTLRRVKAEFEAFLNFIVKHSGDDLSDHFILHDVPLERRSRSCVITLRLSDVLAGRTPVGHEEVVEDAIEVVIDGWDEETRQCLSRSVAMVRRATRTPIIISFEGQDCDRIGLEYGSYTQASLHCLRLCVDYIVANTTLPQECQSYLLQNKGATKMISDHHFENTGPGRWLGSERIKICRAAQYMGYDIVRLTQQATRKDDNEDVCCFLRSVAAAQDLSIPVSAYNLGPSAKPSKISNTILTPVNHLRSERFDKKPTEILDITVRDIVQARFACYEYDALKFWILGTHVSASRTPAMNNSAYKFYGMHHSFDRHHTSNFDDVLALAQDPNFGGAAITTPFKEQAFQACVSSSPHASAIGAANTILPLRQLENGKQESLGEHARQRNRAGKVVGLYGDNSDWAGIYTNIKRRLSPRNAATIMQSTGLVTGAGDSSRSAVYALMQFRMQTICIYNRSHENADRLAEHFRLWGAKNGYQSHLRVLEPPVWPEDLAYPTVIVSCVPPGTIQLSDEMLDSPSGGVVADVFCDFSPISCP